MTRSHGRCPKGERLRLGFPHGHRKTTTLVAGLRMPGMVAPMVPFGKFVTVVPESATGAARPDVVFREISEPAGAAHFNFAAWWRRDNDNPALACFFKLVDERYQLTAAG